MLTFLETPGVEATNWRAEQAIRVAAGEALLATSLIRRLIERFAP